MVSSARRKPLRGGAWLCRNGILRKKIRESIVHECGHVLSAWRSGLAFEYMQIAAVPIQDRPCHVRVACLREAIFGEGPVPPDKVRHVKNLVRLYAAGQIAVLLWGQWVDDPVWEKEDLHQPDTVEFLRLIRRLEATPGYRDRNLFGGVFSMFLEPANWMALVLLVQYVERFILGAIQCSADRSADLEIVAIAGRGLRATLRRADRVAATLERTPARRRSHGRRSYSSDSL